MLRSKLSTQGITITEAAPDTFVARLQPFYARLKQTFGPALWEILEKYSSAKIG